MVQIERNLPKTHKLLRFQKLWAILHSKSSIIRKIISLSVLCDYKSISNQSLVDKFEKLEHYVVYHLKARKARAVIGWPKFHESSCTDSPADSSHHWLLPSRSYARSQQSESQLRRFEIEGSATLFSNISNDEFGRQILDNEFFLKSIDKKFEFFDHNAEELSPTRRQTSSSKSSRSQ